MVTFFSQLLVPEQELLPPRLFRLFFEMSCSLVMVYDAKMSAYSYIKELADRIGSIEQLVQG
jgi:hypothetical protein